MTIVLAVQGLGANWLGCYGNEWVATPNLDRLAAEGAVADHFYAESLAGPDLSGVPATRITAAKSDGLPLAEARRRLESYAPAADEIVLIESDAFAPPWHVPAELFADFYEGEEATPLPEPQDGDDWDRVHASFAAALTMFDAEVGSLMERFPGAKWMVLGTSGYPLGEHDVVGPGTLHEEAVHLPLIVRDGTAAGERIENLLGTGDVAAIIRSVAAGQGVPHGDRTHIITVHDSHAAIRTHDWTLICDGAEPRLHARPADRREVHDVARMHPEVVEELKRLLL